MKIKAEILPNDRKYYGTVIKLTNEEGREAHIEVWINGISNYLPSKREVDFIGEDGKPYIRDEDGEVFEYEICDDHYETQTAFDICKKIVEALNGMEV